MTSDGHLIDSETYVGGHVEAVESGVFRADIACRFKLDIETLEHLKEEIRPTMEHSLRNDAKLEPEELTDFEQVCGQIESQLDALIGRPLLTEFPKLYHLDVGAMYPNIILTNRLQVSTHWPSYLLIYGFSLLLWSMRRSAWHAL